MSTCRLLLDAGNTRLKWAVVEAGRWQAQGSGLYGDLSGLALLLQNKMRCHFASVARTSHTDALVALLAQHEIVPQWLETTSRFAGVENTYANPQQLGVDRWMALLAARQRTESAVLIVSVGTAMTVDALSAEGRFIGGLIVPGVRLMQHALQHGTAQVDGAEGGQVLAFPNSTADAVQSGIISALSGAIQAQYAHLAQAAKMQPRCFLTGGDAERVMPYLDIPFEFVPNLVLEGMERVTRESEIT